MARSDRAVRVAKTVALVALVGVAAVVASPGEAAFPGVPGPVAYSKVSSSSSEYGSKGGIFVLGHLGLAPRQLTDDPEDEDPSYSANGRLIVFSGNRDPVSPTSSYGTGPTST